MYKETPMKKKRIELHESRLVLIEAKAC